MLLLINSLIRSLFGISAIVLVASILYHVFQLKRAQKKYRSGSYDLQQETEKRLVWVGLNFVAITFFIILMVRG